MPTRRPSGARNETIRCENCGEYYSVTYKRCPFCDERTSRRSRREDAYEEYEEDDYEYEDDYEEERPRRSNNGGKRLKNNTRGGGYGGGVSVGRIIGTILSLLLIAAAIFIVYTTVTQLFSKEKPGETPDPGSTSQVSPSPSPVGTPAPSGDPAVTDQPLVSDAPANPTPAPVTGPDTATGFSLGKQEFSLTDTYPDYTFAPVFTPAGTSAAITWSSSNPSIVAVDGNGRVTSGGSKGVVTITATMASGYQATCMVRNQIASANGTAQIPITSTAPSANPAPSAAPTPKPAASAAPSSAPASGLSLSSTDFTIAVGETAIIKAKGATGAVAWAIKDTSIATVSATGTVTGVAKGRTTLTATVDGKTLECIVRVKAAA